MPNNREVAAYRIQRAVCDALCSSDENAVKAAKEWLSLNSVGAGSFAHACSLTGINAGELIELVTYAAAINEPRPIPHNKYNKPKLTLVPTTELE